MSYYVNYAPETELVEVDLHQPLEIEIEEYDEYSSDEEYSRWEEELLSSSQYSQEQATACSKGNHEDCPCISAVIGGFTGVDIDIHSCGGVVIYSRLSPELVAKAAVFLSGLVPPPEVPELTEDTQVLRYTAKAVYGVLVDEGRFDFGEHSCIPGIIWRELEAFAKQERLSIA